MCVPEAVKLMAASAAMPVLPVLTAGAEDLCAILERDRTGGDVRRRAAR